MLQKNFKPVLRFMAVSDIHYQNTQGREQERMKRALKLAYKISESHDTYKKLDAVYVIGDFATSGSREQMLDFKDTLDNGIKPGTETTLMMASHEYHGENGVEGATQRFKEIFNKRLDAHKVINGFHFISLTPSSGCDFNEQKVAFAAEELKKARKDDPKKPIFFFQHPHISDTVSGSINWGEDALYSTLMNYPQVIDFSGHSHAPVNDPRSIHQKHFTSLGTGSISYTELDEFDKVYGTLPPNKENFAQFLLVEADKDGNVRVYPIDVITENFFPLVWEIDEPWNPEKFKYTDERYKNATTPVFPENFKIDFTDVTADGFTLTFPQAEISEYYVNDYVIKVYEKETGLIVRQIAIWSEYYFYNMPEALTQTVSGLDKSTDYVVTITAGSFFNTRTVSEKFDIKTK